MMAMSMMMLGIDEVTAMSGLRGDFSKTLLTQRHVINLEQLLAFHEIIFKTPVLRFKPMTNKDVHILF